MKEVKKIKTVPFTESELDELNEFAERTSVSGNAIVRAATMARVRGNLIELPEKEIEKEFGAGAYLTFVSLMAKATVKELKKGNVKTKRIL